MTEQKVENPSRRRIVGIAAAGVATGALAGVSGGIVLGQSSSPPPIPLRTGAKRFENKVVVVTGGTLGIGRAAALAFAKEGARVGFCGRSENAGRAVEQEIKRLGGEALYVKADVRIETELHAFIDQVVKTYGGLDVAFNNAGITLEKPLHEFTADEWDLIMDTNVRGVFLAMKYQIPHMLDNGGNIVVTSSVNAIATQAGRAVYAASKRALIGLVQGAALDYAERGIRINAVLPGTTDTPLVRKVAGVENMPEPMWRIVSAQWAKSNVPGLGRLASAEEIAAFVLSLASDEHPYITGAAMVIDGGKTAHAG